MELNNLSFKGRIELRMLDLASGINKVQKFRTKKADDELLLKLAKELNSEPYDGTRKHLTPNDKTKELDAIFERLLKRKLPDEIYIRSISSHANSFLYLIAHPDSFELGTKTLVHGGMSIDFFA